MIFIADRTELIIESGVEYALFARKNKKMSDSGIS